MPGSLLNPLANQRLTIHTDYRNNNSLNSDTSNSSEGGSSSKKVSFNRAVRVKKYTNPVRCNSTGDIGATGDRLWFQVPIDTEQAICLRQYNNKNSLLNSVLDSTVDDLRRAVMPPEPAIDYGPTEAQIATKGVKVIFGLTDNQRKPNIDDNFCTCTTVRKSKDATDINGKNKIFDFNSQSSMLSRSKPQHRLPLTVDKACQVDLNGVKTFDEHASHQRRNEINRLLANDSRRLQQHRCIDDDRYIDCEILSRERSAESSARFNGGNFHAKSGENGCVSYRPVSNGFSGSKLAENGLNGHAVTYMTPLNGGFNQKLAENSLKGSVNDRSASNGLNLSLKSTENGVKSVASNFRPVTYGNFSSKSAENGLNGNGVNYKSASNGLCESVVTYRPPLSNGHSTRKSSINCLNGAATYRPSSKTHPSSSLESHFPRNHPESSVSTLSQAHIGHCNANTGDSGVRNLFSGVPQAYNGHIGTYRTASNGHINSKIESNSAKNDLLRADYSVSTLSNAVRNRLNQPRNGITTDDPSIENGKQLRPSSTLIAQSRLLPLGDFNHRNHQSTLNRSKSTIEILPNSIDDNKYRHGWKLPPVAPRETLSDNDQWHIEPLISTLSRLEKVKYTQPALASYTMNRLLRKDQLNCHQSSIDVNTINDKPIKHQRSSSLSRFFEQPIDSSNIREPIVLYLPPPAAADAHLTRAHSLITRHLNDDNQHDDDDVFIALHDESHCEYDKKSKLERSKSMPRNVKIPWLQRLKRKVKS